MSPPLDNLDPARPGAVRAPIHLEEAPCFVLGHRMPALTQYVWHQEGRSWRIHGDSHHPWAGDFAQRLWLAVLRLYDEQGRPADGRVFYNAAEIADIMKASTKSNNLRVRIAHAIEQIDAIRIYVHGEPLPGPHVAPVRNQSGSDRSSGLQRSPITLYTLFGGEGHMALEEEGTHGQLPLFANQGVRRPHRANMRRLSGYVVESLRGQTGRIVPDFVFDLPPYAVRLVRLLGKRAYDRNTLSISLNALAPALPALGTNGKPLREYKLKERLEQAHRALMDTPFLVSMPKEERGIITYRFGSEFSGQRRQLTTTEREFLDELIDDTGRPDNASFYRKAIRLLGVDRLRGCVSEAKRSTGSDYATRVGARITEAMRQHQRERDMIRDELRRVIDAQ